jgi:hypothetical protein
LYRARILVVLLLAVAAAGAIPVSAQDANSAKAFLVEAYTHYGNISGGIDFMGPGANRYYHSSLIALMQADTRAAGPDDAGTLDNDPLCACDNWDDIFDLKIDVQLQDRQRALANVSFSPSNPEEGDSSSWRKLRIELRTEHGEWRIYDILDNSSPTGPSDLRDELTNDIQSLKQASKS